MKKLLITLVCVGLFVFYAQAQQAKYVIYFIGDGMGVNQVLGTELYRGELDGKIGITPLLFTQFPYVTMATTFSASSDVTDSAASGTALATGKKTKNGALGMLQDLETKVNSIAVRAKQNDFRVGIATSVSVDHATPAAFYAHQSARSSYYDIGKDLIAANFDFYAGSDFCDSTNKKVEGRFESLYKLVGDVGYTLVRGYENYCKAEKGQKLILLQPETAKDPTSLPYAIDRKEGDLTLEEITRAGIDFLSKDNDKGFFLMVEGGKIDWACHNNDAATVFCEIMDLDNAVKAAYEFYEQHPDETLIVVTADHETGGIVLGTGKYELNLQVLQSQTMSEAGYTLVVNQLLDQYNGRIPWEVVKTSLADNFGLWKTVQPTAEQEAHLKSICDEMAAGSVELIKSEYQLDNSLAVAAKKILNEAAFVGWTSGGHSGGYVPVYAIGAGAEQFQGRMDNAEIPLKIARIAGYDE